MGRRATADQASRRTKANIPTTEHAGLDRTCTPPGAFCTSPARRLADDRNMDLVAVVLGLVMFAVLLMLIEGIDKV
jgi:hypothetical protein